MASKIKDKFLNRSWMILGGFVLLFLIISVRISLLQTVKKDSLLKENSSLNATQIQSIKAKRGNIYANDGSSILATSVPEYQVVFDPTVAHKDSFKKKIDGLSNGLSRFFKDKSAAQYKADISKARENNVRYIKLSNRKLDYNEMQSLMSLPLFKEGRYKGGGYFITNEIRFHPYKSLALRTIGGIDKEGSGKGVTGVEAEFDNYLSGREGRGYYEKLPGGYLKPITLDSDIGSEPGLDVVTTIDVNFQDIVESTLRNQMMKTGAKYGSVVIMEIATGEIKAMANLSRVGSRSGPYYYLDNQNYAVTGGTDPGSVFKLASVLAAVEKAKMKPDDFAVDCSGRVRHRSRTLTCDNAHGRLTVQEVFEKSCNVGVYAIMKKAFDMEKGDDFFKYIEKFKLNSTTGFQLKGEPAPVFNSPGSKSFSAYTIPWLSIGYESAITPMQILTFYNAVANDGYWVQPLLVKEIRSGKKVVNTFSSNKITSPIASATSIKYMKQMLEGVVLRGTANNINNGECSVAGKTGTAQKMINGTYRPGVYYTSFAGYFPTDNPKYSCIVVIDEPLGDNNYSRQVSAPVFKTIAEKIFAFDMGIHKTNYINKDKTPGVEKMSLGKTHDQKAIARKLKMDFNVPNESWNKPVKMTADSLIWQNVNIDNDLNNLIGLNLKDALPVLENRNYTVRYSGRGKVAEIDLVSKGVVNLTLK